MTTVSVDFLQQITLLDPMNRKQIITELKKIFTKPLLISDYKKIWKALYYAMWSSDKYQNQQILATEISQLTRMFYSNFSAFIQFTRAMFHVFMAEWEKIDYWRINKFMLLFREIIEEHIKICKHFNWKTVPQLNALYTETILNLTEFQTVQGATLHFIQIFVQCMAKYMNDANTTYIQVKELIQPFLDILKQSPNKTLRDKVYQYVFEYLKEKQNSEQYLVSFEAVKYGTYAFKLASQETMNPQNRKSLYQVAELLQFAEEEDEQPQTMINEADSTPKTKKKKNQQEKQIMQSQSQSKKGGEQQQQQRDQEAQQLRQTIEIQEVAEEGEQQQSKQQVKKNGKAKQQKEQKNLEVSGKKKLKEEKTILKQKQQQAQQLQQESSPQQENGDEEDTIEGEDYSEVRKNPEKLKILREIMNSVPVYLFMSPAEKRKYFKSINNRFQETLQKEKGTHCTHNKSVHFDLAKNKVKSNDSQIFQAFKQTDNVLRISKQ